MLFPVRYENGSERRPYVNRVFIVTNVDFFCSVHLKKFSFYSDYVACSFFFVQTERGGRYCVLIWCSCVPDVVQ